jgi:hypothetical protein
MAAGGFCNIITNPIWVVRTRLMAQYLHHKDYHYDTTSPFSVIREIYQKVAVYLSRRGLGHYLEELQLLFLLLATPSSTSSYTKSSKS